MLLVFLKGIRPKGLLILTSISMSLFTLAIFCLPADSLSKPPDFCDSLLKLRFNDTLPAEEQQYLGITGKNVFRISDMKGTIFVIEVFSTYCIGCPKDVPVINETYSSLKNDPGLRENVRVFSIAIGNNRTEAENYKKERKILYPVLTDYDFDVHKTLGNPRVPYTLIVRKTSKGRCTVEYSHQGILPSTDLILKKLKSCVP
ncbi:MAG: TlpA disulfide reductase family protein [Thermodesulfovibrionales bacterium]|nr:TlpA disulfide reductase family protein [Thermodesulfovibrionales bacterium]